MRYAYRILFIVAFLAMTLLPASQMLASWAPDDAVNEQRTLAPEPSFAHPSRAPAEANAWYSDHFGLRSLLIRVKAEIDYRFFRFSDRVHIGNDGYLFYRSTLDMEKPRIERMLAAAEPAMVSNLRRYTEALQRKGINVIVAVNLLGDRFHPEKLPADVASRRLLRRIDGFIEHIRKIPGVEFIDTTALLEQERKTIPIFHRTDFHWNDPAAFSTTKAMVDMASRNEGRSSSVWAHQLKYDTRKFSGGIALFMPLFDPMTEVSIFTHDNWPVPAGFKREMNVGPYEKVTTTTRSPKLLEPVYVIGDSFMDCIERNGFSEYFSETYRLRWHYQLTLSKITADLPPKTRTVVLQFIEVNASAFEALEDTDDVDVALAMLNKGRHEKLKTSARRLGFGFHRYLSSSSAESRQLIAAEN